MKKVILWLIIFIFLQLFSSVVSADDMSLSIGNNKSPITKTSHRIHLIQLSGKTEKLSTDTNLKLSEIMYLFDSMLPKLRRSKNKLKNIKLLVVKRGSVFTQDFNLIITEDKLFLTKRCHNNSNLWCTFFQDNPDEITEKISSLQNYLKSGKSTQKPLFTTSQDYIIYFFPGKENTYRYYCHTISSHDKSFVSEFYRLLYDKIQINNESWQHAVIAL